MSAPAPSASLSAAATDTAAAAAASSKRSLPSADERRVQPRLDHGESDSAGHMPSSSSISSSNNNAAADSTRPPPAARLYRHALECILAFSDAKTLVAALRVSKEWLSAVGSMGRLALTVECSSLPAESAVALAMARHVVDLNTRYVGDPMSAEAMGGLARHMPHLSRLQCWAPRLPADGPLRFPAQLRELQLASWHHIFSAAQINTASEAISRLEQLESLEWRTSLAPLAALPFLRRLQCCFPLLPADGRLLFPAGLRELDLLALEDLTSVAEINAAIEGVGRLMLLESLVLEFPRMYEFPRMDEFPLISFAPLAAPPLLRRLSINVAANTVLTDAQVDELRALPRLHSLHVRPTSLRRLLVPPHDLQWQRISLPSELSNADAALLPQLPSLTALDLNGRYLSSIEFLQRLPNLTSVHCSSVHDRPDAQLTDQLAVGLRHCASLAKLTLDFCNGLTSTHLADLLPRLPRLQSLTLSFLEIDSLGFLAQAPMTGQLSSLTLSYCTRLPVAELRHLHELRGLRELSIDDSFNERVDPDCESLRALRPPSAALPLLESFTFRARDFEAEVDY